MKPVFPRAAGAILAVLLSTPAAAANLLLNPQFTGSATGWATSELGGLDAGTLWHDLDNRSPGGGFTLRTEAAGAQASLFQCVPITEQTVDAYAYMKLLDGHSDPNYGTFTLASYASPDCSGPALAIASRPRADVELASPWVLHRIDGIDLPATTQSVRVGIDLVHSNRNTREVVLVDDVAFGPTGTLGLPARGPNFVQNADFHHDIYLWQRNVPVGSAYYAGFSGMPDIGGAFLIGVDGYDVNVSQCVELPDGVLDIYVLSDNTEDDYSEVELSFHGDIDCATTPLHSEIATAFRWPVEWTLHHLLDYQPPAGSVAARMTLRATENGITIFDHAVIGLTGTVDRPATTYTVFMDGFE